MANSHRPNMVVVQADQLTSFALGCYGHPSAKTPNLDALADDGVVFENAYCNSPLCGPSRASMVTGILPHRIGAYPNPGTSVRRLDESGPCRWNMQADYDEETLHRGLRRMRELTRARRETGRPFFLTFSFTQPHDPFVALNEYWRM